MIFWEIDLEGNEASQEGHHLQRPNAYSISYTVLLLATSSVTVVCVNENALPWLSSGNGLAQLAFCRCPLHAHIIGVAFMVGHERREAEGSLTLDKGLCQCPGWAGTKESSPSWLFCSKIILYSHGCDESKLSWLGRLQLESDCVLKAQEEGFWVSEPRTRCAFGRLYCTSWAIQRQPMTAKRAPRMERKEYQRKKCVMKGRLKFRPRPVSLGDFKNATGGCE